MSVPVEITRLEGRIADLEAQQQVLEQQLLDARIDQFEGRIQDLELQLHLGELEVRDRLAPIVAALRNQFLDAKALADGRTGAAGDVLAALRDGLERAIDDLRAAVDDARKAATS